MGDLGTALAVAATVGTGLVGGVFAAFSGFVLPALDRLSPQGATAAMQSINVTAVRPPLMVALFGTAALVVAVPVLALRQGSPASALVLVAGALYLVGTVGTTVVGNVPLNEALARVDPATTTAPAWTTWSRAWAARNHVRTGTALAAAALHAVALLG